MSTDNPQLPPGFQESPGGLLVPKTAIQSVQPIALEHVTWGPDDPARRALERAMVVAQKLDLQLVLRCVHRGCIENDLACTYLITRPHSDGSEWVCNHLVRLCPASPQQERAVLREAARRGRRLRRRES
jgi:hypothetical protein